MCGPFAAGKLQTATASVNLADLPSYQFFPELSIKRGVFQRIKANKIDLPSNRPPPKHENAQLWIHRLPDQIRLLFADAINPLRESVTSYIKAAKNKRALPQSLLYASQKEYAALLRQAEDAGMLHWSVVGMEDSEYSSLAADIEMTMFAVSKSNDCSRLISWPRVQNDAMPQPPYTSLPNPSMFEAIRMPRGSPKAFFLDISNMFHSITLPLWLARLFPMKPILLSHLSAETKRCIAQRTPIPSGNADVLLRPFQATLPMGFQWAVFIAQNFVSSCFEQSFRLLKSSRLAPTSMALSTLQAEEAPFLVTKHSPLLLHIIDDAAVITADWPAALVTLCHRLTRNILRINQLPVSDRKSSKTSEVIQNSVNVIGCTSHLREGTVSPARDKMERITASVKGMLEARSCTRKVWVRVTGKLLWFATLSRPLLACTQSSFFEGISDNPILQRRNSDASKREIRTLAALLPLARVDVNLPIIIVAFDASKMAGAVTYAYATSKLVESLWAAAQTARFSRSVQNNEQLQEVTHVIQACKWKLAFIHYWKREEHINCLKAATAVLSAEWLTRSRMSRIRAIFLTDFLVTLGALHKGRSSKTGILLRCRRFAALVLAHELRITFAFVRSSMNPADKYTRIPKPRLPQQSASADHATN